MNAIKPSATVAISGRAKELKAAGVDVISFSLGEPDFDTPGPICEAAKQAIDDGAGHYTIARGIAELRDAICARSKDRRGGIEYKPEEVVVSVGAKHALFNLALALYDEGDEILIPVPYWVSYPAQARLLGAVPRSIPTTAADGFRLTPEALDAAVTEKTKALILCSPSNPTGAAYSGEQLAALADVARKHSFWIITDEIYGELVYGDFEQRSIVEVAPDLRDRIIIVDGVSKTYAMTGWRIGWILAPTAVAKACDKIQSQSTTNPTAAAQYAAVAALTGSQAPVQEMRKAFEARRRLVVDALNAIEGVHCRMPEGAFYGFPNVEELVGKRAGAQVLEDDVALANYLLEEAKVAVVPGTAFGAPGHIRISYAAGEETLKAGVSRIREALGALA